MELLELSDDDLQKIFSYLSIEEYFRARILCKTINTILSDQDFLALFFSTRLGSSKVDILNYLLENLVAESRYLTFITLYPRLFKIIVNDAFEGTDRSDLRESRQIILNRLLSAATEEKQLLPLKTYEYLLQSGADPTTLRADGRPVIHYALSDSSRFSLAEVFLKSNANLVNFRYKIDQTTTRTPIQTFLICLNNSHEQPLQVSSLLNFYAYIRFHLMIDRCRKDFRWMMQWLPHMGYGRDKGFLLVKAVSLKLYDAAEKLLVAAGAAVDFVDDSGYAAIHYAVLTDNLQMLKLLVKHGANIHLPCLYNSYQPIHFAYEKKLNHIIVYLLEQPNFILVENNAALDYDYGPLLYPLYCHAVMRGWLCCYPHAWAEHALNRALEIFDMYKRALVDPRCDYHDAGRHDDILWKTLQLIVGQPNDYLIIPFTIKNLFGRYGYRDDLFLPRHMTPRYQYSFIYGLAVETHNDALKRAIEIAACADGYHISADLEQLDKLIAKRDLESFKIIFSLFIHYQYGSDDLVWYGNQYEQVKWFMYKMAQANWFEGVEYLLQLPVAKKFLSFYSDEQGYTALHYALLQNNIRMFVVLIQYGFKLFYQEIPEHRNALEISITSPEVTSETFFQVLQSCEPALQESHLLSAINAGEVDKLVSMLSYDISYSSRVISLVVEKISDARDLKKIRWVLIPSYESLLDFMMYEKQRAISSVPAPGVLSRIASKFFSNVTDILFAENKTSAALPVRYPTLDEELVYTDPTSGCDSIRI